MDFVEYFDGFDLDDDEIIDEQIESTRGVESNIFVANRNFILTPNIQALLNQLVREACFVNRFQQPRPQLCMHLHHSTDDSSA